MTSREIVVAFVAFVLGFVCDVLLIAWQDEKERQYNAKG